jgi:hypothetical protein
MVFRNFPFLEPSDEDPSGLGVGFEEIAVKPVNSVPAGSGHMVEVQVLE